MLRLSTKQFCEANSGEGKGGDDRGRGVRLGGRGGWGEGERRGWGEGNREDHRGNWEVGRGDGEGVRKRA